MQFSRVMFAIAEVLKEFDRERPVDNEKYRPGIGPFREKQLAIEIARRLSRKEVEGFHFTASTHQQPDMRLRVVDPQGFTVAWAVELKIVRPFGDNGSLDEHWSKNLLHPYEGNTSLIGDALKLLGSEESRNNGLIAICYEHRSPKVELEPLIASFELIAKAIKDIPLGERTEERREGLVHPEHQVLRLIGWPLVAGAS